MLVNKAVCAHYLLLGILQAERPKAMEGEADGDGADDSSLVSCAELQALGSKLQGC